MWKPRWTADLGHVAGAKSFAHGLLSVPHQWPEAPRAAPDHGSSSAWVPAVVGGLRIGFPVGGHRYMASGSVGTETKPRWAYWRARCSLRASQARLTPAVSAASRVRIARRAPCPDPAKTSMRTGASMSRPVR